MNYTNRRTYLKAIASVPLIGAFAGCLGDGDGTGTLATHVTDQPTDIDDFQSCVVTINGIWLGTEESEAGDEDDATPTDREYHEFDEPQEADLVDLQGEETQLIDERELDVETYAFIQLDTDGIDATLDDGSDATVEVPGNAPLTFNEEFDIREETKTTFTADFTPVQQGATGEYVLQPVPDGITVVYEDEEATEE